MMQWQYMQLAIAQQDLMLNVEKAGQEGWEVCGLLPGSVQKSVLDAHPVPGFILLLKRPIEGKTNGQGTRSDADRSGAKAAGGTEAERCS